MPAHRLALSASSTWTPTHRPTPPRATVILDIPAQHHSPPLERPLQYTATARTFRRHPLRTPLPAQHSTGAHETTIRVAAPWPSTRCACSQLPRPTSLALPVYTVFAWSRASRTTTATICRTTVHLLSRSSVPHTNTPSLRHQEHRRP
jgi:hypothetical protein